MDVLQDLGRHLVFPIDFESQAYTERISKLGLYAVTVISCVVGYASNSIKICAAVFVAGVIGVMAAVLPAYPAYNKNRPKWVSSGPKVVLADE